MEGAGEDADAGKGGNHLDPKRRLTDAIASFMGSDILIQIRRKPNWKDSLDASRERLACREERRHL